MGFASLAPSYGSRYLPYGSRYLPDAWSAQVSPRVGFLDRLLPARAPDRFLVGLLDLCGFFLLLLQGPVPLGLGGVLLGVSRHRQQPDDCNSGKDPHFSLPPANQKPARHYHRKQRN